MMKYNHLFFAQLIAVICILCSSTIYEVAQVSDSEATNIRNYFPAGIFDPNDASYDSAIAAGFENYFHRIGEPSLYRPTVASSATVYRVVRRFFPSGTAICIRINERPDGSADVTVTQTSGGSGATKRFQSKTIISSVDFQRFVTLVNSSQFWSLASFEVQEGIQAKDGDLWMIEGVENGKYHLVYRINPKPSRFTEIGRVLANEIAGLADSVFSVPKFSPDGRPLDLRK